MTTTTDNHFIAQAVHDLGTALWFGGSVMGIAGVNKSGSDLSTGIDKVRVASSAWSRFAPAQWAGVAATLGTGLIVSGSPGGFRTQESDMHPGAAVPHPRRAALREAGARRCRPR